MSRKDEDNHNWSEHCLASLKEVRVSLVAGMLRRKGVECDDLQIARKLEKDSMLSTFNSLLNRSRNKGFFENMRVIYLRFRDTVLGNPRP